MAPPVKHTPNTAPAAPAAPVVCSARDGSFEPRAAICEIAAALCDVADQFTCAEAEEVTRLLCWAGAVRQAESFLTCHGVYGDTDVDDRHRTPAAVLAALDALEVEVSARSEDRVAFVARMFENRR